MTGSTSTEFFSLRAVDQRDCWGCSREDHDEGGGWQTQSSSSLYCTLACFLKEQMTSRQEFTYALPPNVTRMRRRPRIHRCLFMAAIAWACCIYPVFQVYHESSTSTAIAIAIAIAPNKNSDGPTVSIRRAKDGPRLDRSGHNIPIPIPIPIASKSDLDRIPSEATPDEWNIKRASGLNTSTKRPSNSTSNIKSKSRGNHNHNNFNHSTRPWSSTILWGIPSVWNDQREKDRRKAIRDTYLSYYKYNDDFYSNTNTPDRICSLHQLQTQRVHPEDCQIAYAFFVGANPNGPTGLVDPNASFPMLVNRSQNIWDQEEDEDEDDIVHLNIQENMEDGKMVTWFRYASMVVASMAEEEGFGFGFGFDYIAKVDSDTLVFMPTFLETLVQEELKPYPDNIRIYGGLPFDNHMCDMSIINDTHPCPLPLVSDRYMSGELYFMSPDLASFIGSNQVNRQKLTIRHEDVSSLMLYGMLEHVCLWLIMASLNESFLIALLYFVCVVYLLIIGGHCQFCV
jgi:hypothetical protein